MSRFLNIGLGADSTQLQKDMAEAASVVQSGSNKMADAAVAGGAKMEQAQAKTAKASQTLAQQYRQADKDAQRLAESQGMQSEAFRLASQRAGELKDQLMEVRGVSTAFASDTPVLSSAIPVMQGLAGAYSAAQGAAALFGAENEMVQQTMMKVQAAMALTQGLQAVGTLRDSWMVFSNVMQAKVLPAIMTVNGALTMGAAAVAIAAYMVLSQAVENYNSKLEREIALEKEAIEQKKLNAEATNKAASNYLRSEDLRVKAMKDGLAKDLAAINVKLMAEKQKEKEIFEASNKTYIDKARLEENLKNIEKNYQNERLKATQDFEDKKRKAADDAAKEDAKRAAARMQTFRSTDPSSPVQQKLNPANYKPVLIAQENFQNQSRASAQAWANDMANFNLQATQAIESGLEQTIGTMAATLGQALTEGGNFAEAGAAVLLNAVGSMAVQLGQLAIATGITMSAIKKAFTNPFTAIAAGVALVAVGSYVSAQAKAITAGGSGGGGNMPGMGGGDGPEFQRYQFEPTNSVLNVGGVVRGGDMVIAINNTERNNRRTR
jgi:hypothetical protein